MLTLFSAVLMYGSSFKAPFHYKSQPNINLKLTQA